MGTLSPTNTSSWVRLHTLLGGDCSSTQSWAACDLASSASSKADFSCSEQKMNVGGRMGIMKTQANKQAKDQNNNQSQNSPKKPEQGTWAESDHEKYLMWAKKSTNYRGHIPSRREGIGVFWQQWDLSLCSPREPQSGSISVSPKERSSCEAGFVSFPLWTDMHISIYDGTRRLGSQDLQASCCWLPGRWLIFYFPGAQSRTIRYWAPTCQTNTKGIVILLEPKVSSATHCESTTSLVKIFHWLYTRGKAEQPHHLPTWMFPMYFLSFQAYSLFWKYKQEVR